MGNLHDDIVEAINVSDPGANRQALVHLKFTAQAWASAMLMAYKTYYPKTGTYIDVGEKARDFPMPSVPVFEDDSLREASNPCSVDLHTPRLHYPPNAAFRGSVGSVVTRLKFGEDGKVTDSELLATVPTGIFARSVMDKADRFYLEKLNEDEDCQYPAQIVQTFSFYIQ